MIGIKMIEEIKEQGEKIKECSNYNEKKIIELAQIIKNFNPKTIVIVGRGTSYHIGIYAKYLFELYTHIPVSIASQSISTIYNNRVDYSKSVIIAISQSGNGLDTLEVVKKANQDEALTIGVINELNSLLGKEVKHILYLNCGKAESYAATKTYTTSIYLIQRLVYEISKNKDLNLTLNDIVSSLNIGLGLEGKIKEIVANYKNVNELFVLTRGQYLTLAIELSLKLKEGCCINASGYPISEFLHGPISVLNNSRPIILFAIDKKISKDVANIINKLKSMNINTLLITNDKSLLNMASKEIYIDLDDKKSFYVCIMILQLFAYELATIKNIDPDYIDVLSSISTY